MIDTKLFLKVINSRRSVGRLRDPGPSHDEITTLIRAAISAPDHGKLRPWRFIVFTGTSRSRFGDIMAEAMILRNKDRTPTLTESQLEKERNKFLRAPVVIATIVKVGLDSNIPPIEQYAAVISACQNILLAATSLGYGSMWRTGEPAYDPQIKKSLGLNNTDMIAGFLYLGTIDPQFETSDKTLDPNDYLAYWD